jgi:hypothetical protein
VPPCWTSSNPTAQRQCAPVVGVSRASDDEAVSDRPAQLSTAQRVLLLLVVLLLIIVAVVVFKNVYDDNRPRCATSGRVCSGPAQR